MLVVSVGISVREKVQRQLIAALKCPIQAEFDQVDMTVDGVDIFANINYCLCKLEVFCTLRSLLLNNKWAVHVGRVRRPRCSISYLVWVRLRLLWLCCEFLLISVILSSVLGPWWLSTAFP